MSNNKITKTVLALLASTALLVGATACGNGNSNSQPEYTRADCKTRLEADMNRALADPDWAGNTDRPKECTGVSDKVAEDIVVEVMTEAMEREIDKAFEEEFGDLDD